jgi:hypothetical protein
MLEVLLRAITQEKEIKVIQMGKEEVKLSMYADDMIPYLKTLNHRRTLISDKQFQQTARYIIGQKNSSFSYTNNKLTVKELMKTIPFTITSKE